MTFIQKPAICLAVAAVGCALTSCQPVPYSKEGASYTAARHMSTGSHVPQANDANSTSTVFSPGSDPNALGGTRTNQSNSLGGR